MTAKLISDLRVEGLFGLYTYLVPEGGDLSNAAILYGDNGVGKSTLLRLVFHLLSAANDRGHRNALYEAEFKSLAVGLSSGARLTARQSGEASQKVLHLDVQKEGKRLASWDYRPPRLERAMEQEAIYVEWARAAGKTLVHGAKQGRQGAADGVPRGQEAYLEVLRTFVPALFILNADRRLDSDAVADPSDEVELRRAMRMGEPKKINELVARSREIALSQALGAASRWIGQIAVRSANQGSMNVHSVYGDVLRKVLSPSSRRVATASPVEIPELLERLAHVDAKSAEHARYEFATHLPTGDFRKALSGTSLKKTRLAAELLEPYIRSVEGRLEAVEPIYRRIDKFIEIVNGLLADKALSFKLSQGFTIQNRLGRLLGPEQLSSGEQQLLLLFCYVLVARDTPTVFMIDEPELSLNVKWQRQLVQALLDITDKADIQFVFASHSMELLAQHRNRVVKLVNR